MLVNVHMATSPTLHVFAKDARIHTSTKLYELLGELEGLDWDVLLFSKTRAQSATSVLEGALYTSLAHQKCSSVGISVHSKHAHRMANFQSFSDRAIAIDAKFKDCSVCFTAAYLPHCGYSEEILHTTYDQLHFVVFSATARGFRVTIGGDFICYEVRTGVPFGPRQNGPRVARES